MQVPLCRFHDAGSMQVKYRFIDALLMQAGTIMQACMARLAQSQKVDRPASRFKLQASDFRVQASGFRLP